MDMVFFFSHCNYVATYYEVLQGNDIGFVFESNNIISLLICIDGIFILIICNLESLW
jgi:hypothetical protein